MKKVILLLILVLPVIIASIAFAVAGFVAPRTVMYTEIDKVFVSANNFNAFNAYYDGDFHDPDDVALDVPTYYLRGNYTDQFGVNPGQSYPFAQFFTVQPSRAKDTLFNNPDNFIISNPEAVKVENGRIYILQNRRTSDGNYVTIEVRFGLTLLFFVEVVIAADNNRFDYFGFDHGLLENGLLVYGEKFEFASVVSVAGEKIIQLDSNFSQVALGQLLLEGINLAPTGLFGRTEFQDSLTFISNNTNMLTISGDGKGIGTTANILTETGEVTVTIRTSWKAETEHPDLEKEVTITIRIENVEN